ncbi:MAG: DUF4293 domain-containing protein [Sphingobacteriales bacterium]|jgi:hypothetical protein|nr:DUF4293 domain-containing protein [Sphingobacteriales bacterium]
MIQRVQTIYLLLAALACIAFIFVPFGQIKTPEGGTETWAIKQVTPVMISAIVVAATSLISIFLFKNRRTQMKLVLVNIMLSVALIGLFVFGVTQHIGLRNYTFGIGAILPLFILLFNMLAYGSIKSDENLVKSMDRLR